MNIHNGQQQHYNTVNKCMGENYEKIFMNVK